MDFQLSTEQREMVNTVRALTQEKIKPRALKYMDGTFPWENMKELAELGVLGMAVCMMATARFRSLLDKSRGGILTLRKPKFLLQWEIRHSAPSSTNYDSEDRSCNRT